MPPNPLPALASAAEGSRATPALRTTLLRLLEDWEAGRCTPLSVIGAAFGSVAIVALTKTRWVRWVRWADGTDRLTLTTAGLAAARREKGE